MSGTDIDLTTLLEQTIGLALQSMAGPIIGRINSYNSAKNRCNVTPLVPLLVAGEWQPTPTLPEVPVAWPGATTASLKFPLLAGALVELRPLGHDHSDWTVSGTPNIPAKSERRFSLADLVAHPSAPSPLATPPDPLSYDAAWAVLFGQIKAGDSTATAFVALADKVLTELQSIKTWADVHMHGPGTYTTAGGPVTLLSGPPENPPATPAPMPAPGSVACTKLKAK